jgi:hypothetical protein
MQNQDAVIDYNKIKEVYGFDSKKDEEWVYSDDDESLASQF